MATAFQANAFQNNAFQIDSTPPPTPESGGGGGEPQDHTTWRKEFKRKRKLKDLTEKVLRQAFREAMGEKPDDVVAQIEPAIEAKQAFRSVWPAVWSGLQNVDWVDAELSMLRAKVAQIVSAKIAQLRADEQEAQEASELLLLLMEKDVF